MPQRNCCVGLVNTTAPRINRFVEQDSMGLWEKPHSYYFNTSILVFIVKYEYRRWNWLLYFKHIWSSIILLSQQRPVKHNPLWPIRWLGCHRALLGHASKFFEAEKKMATISQTIFSNAFSRTKTVDFQVKVRRNMFLVVQLTIIEHWFRLCLASNRRQANIGTNGDLVYWRMYTSLGLHWLILCLDEI